MFVYYYANVAMPLAAVEAHLDELVGEMEGWAAEAHRNGEEVATRLRVGNKAVTKEIELRVWPVTQSEEVTTRKLTWRATGPSALFPELDADLVAAGLDDDLTQLSLRGSYEPPLGVVGRSLDRALFHRLAEMTVKQFVDRVVEAVASRQEVAGRA